MFGRAAVVIGALLFGSPVFAQSSLGITGATLKLASTEDEAGTAQGSLAASVDVRITEVHGLQGGLSFAETATGTLGSLDGHLYMAPRPGQKYGLFLSVSDMDGRSMAWGTLGAEAMFAFGESSVVEGRVGLGAANGSSLDFIFAGISVAHAFSPAFEVEAALDVADFDETAFRATSLEASLTARYSPEGSPWGAYVSASRSDLTGRDGAAASHGIGFGVTLNLGTAGGTDPDTRMFRTTDPVAPLIRRGIY
jgi:hypothetical protein